MEFYSGDFQCPDTGWGVYLIFNEDNEQITAEVCNTGIWDTDDTEHYTDEIEKDTKEWCRKFGNKYCADMDEANKLADKYDTWFR